MQTMPSRLLWFAAYVATSVVALQPSSTWQHTHGRPRTSLRRHVVTAALDPRSAVAGGMEKFRKGDVEGSVAEFNQAIAADKRYSDVLWQRGLSLYYAEQFAEGAEQFRRDVRANPNDTEEAIWTFLCEARMPSLGFRAARENMLKVGRDPRPVMRTANELFLGKASEGDLAQAGHQGGKGSKDEFYANLYLGLYAEASGDETKAKSYIVAAADSPYGPRSNDYMWSLAVVHRDRRKW